jgi:hypothetical protein
MVTDSAYPVPGTTWHRTAATHCRTLPGQSHAKCSCNSAAILVILVRLLKLGFFGQIFKKLSNIKFYDNPSSGSRFVLCGQTDMTELIIAFSRLRRFTRANVTDCLNRRWCLMKSVFEQKTLPPPQKREMATASVIANLSVFTALVLLVKRILR